MSMPSDLQSIITAAARPLRPSDVEAFEAAVAEALRGQQPGPGSVFRVCREVQKRYFDPPGLTHRGARLG